MQFMPNRTTLIQIGGFSITWYAICILVGACFAYLISKYRFKKRNYSVDLSDYFVYLMFIGIVGARIWYCVFKWNDLYAANPIDVFKIYEGGLAIQGGLIAGLIYSVFFFKKNNIPFEVAGDCIMPTVLLAQACGRWGNFFNQEAYGQAISEAQINALHLPSFIKEGMYINGSYYQPTFLYESVLNIIGCIVIIFIIHKICKLHGVEFGSYFIWYGVARFFVESFRSDSLMLGNLKMAQVTSIAFIILGIIIWIYARRKGEKYA